MQKKKKYKDKQNIFSAPLVIISPRPPMLIFWCVSYRAFLHVYKRQWESLVHIFPKNWDHTLPLTHSLTLLAQRYSVHSPSCQGDQAHSSKLLPDTPTHGYATTCIRIFSVDAASLPPFCWPFINKTEINILVTYVSTCFFLGSIGKIPKWIELKGIVGFFKFYF